MSRRAASLRALILGGAATLVLVACLLIAGLLALTARMRAAMDREARILFAEQQTAAEIGREVERQLLDAAEYLNRPASEVLERFRARGQHVYALERRYLFRELSLAERLQVERVKELHQALEVFAHSAFDARAAGDGAASAARAQSLFAASEPVQRALDRFLAMRAEDYRRAHAEQVAVFRRLYLASGVTALLLLLAFLLAVRFVHRRILAPIDALARAAERVGAGDLSARVEERSRDELSRLGGSFNAMTAGLATLQADLRDSEERYRRLVELTPDAIVVHDAERIRLGNPEALRLFGAATADELTRHALPDFLHPDAPPAAAERLRAMIAGGERAAPLELPFRRLDGGRVYGELAAAPLADGREPVTLVAVRDVTARREAEAALRESEERLRQAQKMEAVGQLAGGVAHDFNNLLTVIIGHSDLLLEELPPAPHAVRADVEEIRAAGTRAASLTAQLLAFSRKQLLRTARLDVNRVVAEMTALLRRLIASDIEFRTRLAPELAPVEADRGQLEQVILNLVVNARDAMPNGGRLTVETALVATAEGTAGATGEVPPGRYVALSVTDTGVGMDAATRARIFEPFFTTKPAGKGTGLGLATVHGIVRQSGGHVRVRSEPGRGSTFEVLLPPYEGAEAEGEAPAAAPALPGGHETILLAEDDDAVRAYARRVLRRLGYTVLEARDGAAAQRTAEAHAGPIHLLVTDVVMPGVGGRELARRLARARPGLKVVFTSGHTEDEVLRRGVLAQTHQLLDKPYTPHSLAARVRAALDGARG
jgi:two-component system, cell cycle sensor histidine kinase and response regulator CckA